MLEYVPKVGLELTAPSPEPPNTDKPIAPCTDAQCENARGIPLARLSVPDAVPGRRGAKPGVSQRTTARVATYVRRFWSKVDRSAGPDACWLWAGPVNGKGYGAVELDGHKGAHRVAFYVTHGKPIGDLFVCHRCDTPRCCNPAHLFLGTHQDNMDDCAAKGRTNRGERNRAAKLTAEQVVEIRRRLDSGVSERAIAGAFHVSQATVHYIAIGRIWRHVEAA